MYHYLLLLLLLLLLQREHPNVFKLGQLVKVGLEVCSGSGSGLLLAASGFQVVGKTHAQRVDRVGRRRTLTGCNHRYIFIIRGSIL